MNNVSARDEILLGTVVNVLLGIVVTNFFFVISIHKRKNNNK